MASSLQQMAATITERSKTLINNDLKKICKEEGTAQTGNKALLQSRVIGLIQNAVHRSDTEALQRLQHRVQHHGDAPPPGASSSPAAPSFVQPTHPVANGFPMANGFSVKAAYPPYQPVQAPPRPQSFFKDSPFVEIRELLLSNMPLDASPNHRQTCQRQFALNDAQCARVLADPTLRLYLFGALEQPLAQYTRLDIAFPSQFEVRLNNAEIKANFKGLKNKPGSTRPADITEAIRKTPANQRNTLHVTYALTQKVGQPQEKFNMFVYLAKKFSVDDLTERITHRNVITRESVLDEMMKKANDPDIEVGSSVMSLKDPISTLRITTPCRSMVCTHNQCFDAASFLQLQEQAPTWTCPICSKTVSYESLAVDQYVQEILRKVRTADQVTIQPNGEWSTDKETSQPRTNGYAHADSDDDLIDVTDYRISAIKSEATPVSLSTPPLQSRDSSTAPRSNKREFVDLTISEDDEPPRPAKKVAYNTPHLPDTNRRYTLPLPLNSAAHSRPFPAAYQAAQSTPRSEFPRPPTTPPNQPGYGSYRQPQPGQRHSYGSQGTSQHPTYLGSSSP